jgi:hypothetical protein
MVQDLAVKALLVKETEAAHLALVLVRLVALEAAGLALLD